MTPAGTPYCGPGPLPDELWSRWNLDPTLLAGLALAGLALGLWRRDRRERIAGAGALAVLAIAFVSPLCALSSALFSARTVHHLLLLQAVAPLIALALPRRGLSLVAATLAQAAVLWAWHAPAAYAAALSDHAVYWAMQLSLLAAATGFWVAVRGAGALAGGGALLASVVLTGLLGAVLAFAPDALYAPHRMTTAVWGLTPLEDQQLAGLIMWAPGAALYLAAALAMLWRRLDVAGPDPARP